VLSGEGNEEFRDGVRGDDKGIMKTVSIEMMTRSISTEDILRSRDRF
jgi:hypothetical protein